MTAGLAIFPTLDFILTYVSFEIRVSFKKYFFNLQSSGAPPSAFQVPYDSFRENFESDEADAVDINSASDGLLESKSKDLDYEFICVFLSTQRLDLYRSIDFRCEDMLLGKRMS